jgi:hypothetical protein
MNAWVTRLAATAVALVLARATAASGAIVTYVSQQRSVVADSSPGPDIPGPEAKQQEASGFTPFHGAVNASFLDRPAQVAGGGAARQDSVLSGNVLSVSAGVSGFGMDAAGVGRSQFLVRFDLDQARTFTLDYARATETDERCCGFAGGMLALRRIGDGEAESVVDFSFEVVNEPPLPTASFHKAGTLAAGRYELQADLQASAGPFGSRGVDLSAQLTVGGGVNAIPLPPAVFVGLPLLGVVAWGVHRSKTRRR